MKALVTGGCGFIGSFLVEELVNQGNEVIAFDNGFRTGFSNIDKLQDEIILVKGDVTNKEDWKSLPKDIDHAFHLAAINGTKFFYEIPEKVLKVNILGTLNFFEWLEKTSTKRFFFASSSEVYGIPNIFPTPETYPLSVPDPKNPRYSYSTSKIVGETISINFSKSIGIDYTIGRFHNVYGPKMGFEHVIPEFIRRLVKNEVFTVQGDGTESRCFCYVNDAIEAIMLIMNNEEGSNEIFNIGNPRETTIKGLIESLGKIHGKQFEPIYTKFKNAGTKKRVPDLKRINKLGYEPKISLEDGLKLTYDWYSNYYTNN